MTQIPEQTALVDLTGQTAVVTGAGSAEGIGVATARLLGAMGAGVAIASTTERIHRRVEELAQDGVAALGFVADLTREADVSAFVAAVLAWRPSVDVLPWRI
jgi:3-oxoacyl-[acyl-carrier protein] reductase